MDWATTHNHHQTQASTTTHSQVIFIAIHNKCVMKATLENNVYISFNSNTL